MAIIPFTPVNNQSPPFQSIVTLDGQPYTLQTRWNVAAQRWYVSLTDGSGNVTWYGAMIGSPLGYDIPLALGVFQTSVILFRQDTGNFEVTP